MDGLRGSAGVCLRGYKPIRLYTGANSVTSITVDMSCGLTTAGRLVTQTAVENKFSVDSGCVVGLSV